jgi:hypothetical protein
MEIEGVLTKSASPPPYVPAAIRTRAHARHACSRSCVCAHTGISKHTPTHEVHLHTVKLLLERQRLLLPEG